MVELLPPASVLTLLPVLVSVKVPVPCRPKPEAVIAADCVMPLLACRLVSPLEVSKPLTTILPPYTVISPATEVFDPMMMSPALPTFPKVKPDKLLLKFSKLVFKSAVNDDPKGSMLRAPEVLKPIAPAALRLLVTKRKVLVDVVTAEPAVEPKLIDVLLFCRLIDPDRVDKVTGPLSASRFR